MPIPILILSPTAVPGGAERSLAGLARQLPRFGFEPTAVLLEDGPLARWLRDVGCPTHILPAGRLRRPVSTLRTIAAVGSLVRRGGHELVFSNQAKGHVYGGLAAQMAGVPAVWWQRGIADRNRFDFAAARVPAAAVVCSSGEAIEAQRRRTHRTPTIRIHPGVRADEIASRRGSGIALRLSLGWDENKVVVIVGRLQPWKGHETFLRAAALLHHEFPKARFAIVGGAVLGWEGDYPRELERLADRLGLREAVVFTGHQDDVYPWFDSADVVVHASFGEPFGRVLVEAMALGKPLVAASGSGPSEIVEPGISGLLVPPGDAKALADAVRRILVDNSLAARLAEGGRHRAPHFSEEHSAAQLARLFHRIREGRVSARKEARIGRLA
jgi:glycosyltransferase involved in cell wall biosynthesis